MNFIEKHSKILAVSLCLLTSGPIVSTMYAKEVQPGWHGEGADRYYVLKSNRQTATGLTKIDKELYYFNNNGEYRAPVVLTAMPTRYAMAVIAATDAMPSSMPSPPVPLFPMRRAQMCAARHLPSRQNARIIGPLRQDKEESAWKTHSNRSSPPARGLSAPFLTQPA